MPNIDISSSISGLMPYEKYDYKFEGMGGNWPAIITPISGSIRPFSTEAKIEATVHFCKTKTSCTGSVGLLPYNTGIDDLSKDLYTSIRLGIKPELFNYTLYSDIETIKCSGCLNSTKVNFISPTSGNNFSTITEVSLTGTNIYRLRAYATGLVPKQEYDYSFNVLSSNWPSIFRDASGTFIANNDNETITCDLTFCPVTGMCEVAGKTVSPYSLDNDCIRGLTPPFAKVQLNLSNSCCDNENYSTDPLIVNCINCLPRLSISGPTNISLNTNNNNIYTLIHNISGLRVNENYSYVYEGIESNWPTIISPISGSFVASGVVQNLSTKLMFCYPQNICPSGTPGLINYTIDSFSQKLLKQNVLSTSLKLKVTPESCDIPEKTSVPFVLNCSGCLPAFSYSSIKFDDTPELTLSSACCTGLKSITLNVDNAVPGDEYIYLFDSLSDSVEFAPQSGYAYFDNTGAGYINTIMSSNLIPSQQIIVNCQLTHVPTSIKTIDFLAVKCSGACL